MAGRGRGQPRGGRGQPRGASRAPSQSSAGRGAGRGGRGGGTPVAITPTPSSSIDVSHHVDTVGVRRKGYGSSGTAIKVLTNHFEVKLPTDIIHHYDVMVPDEQKLPMRATMQIMRRLQEVIAPQVFTPRAVYDGRKNLFAIRELPFTEGSQSFDVTLEDVQASAEGQPAGKGPRVYKVKLTKVAEINPEVLARFLEGKQSHDNAVLTAITALNVVVRMQPNLDWPFDKRSFYTNQESLDIGNGIVLWRGLFQSIRPALGRMLINIDISTGYMYKDGPLIDVCIHFLSTRNRRITPQQLAPRSGFPERERYKLEKFLAGVRVTTTNANGQPSRSPRTIKKLSTAGANELVFSIDGQTITVSEHFRRARNRPLQFPALICVEFGNGALVPLEMCHVPAGQIMRKQVPDDKVKDVVAFATKKPGARLASIYAGIGVLAYGQSEYVRQFGLQVNGEAPITANARILAPPTLKYGDRNLTPRDGSWNMVDRKFYKPSVIERWCVVIFERENSFGRPFVQNVIQGFSNACRSVGMTIQETDPVTMWCNPQTNIDAEMKKAGQAVMRKNGPGKFPTLMIVILPENAAELYRAIKHFGDISLGIATQCMKAMKCSRGNAQYYANICLKVNVKLGGINAILDQRSAVVLTDPRNPTIVMGADVIHPAPGSQDRPSFASLVANVDSDTAKYIADCRVQKSRQEMIGGPEDDDPALKSMVKNMLTMHMAYRQMVEKQVNKAPKRLIFYRDGVSEGQFAQVLNIELPQIKAACRELAINPRITIIVVGKRHHVRFFPRNPGEGDRSENCKAGTVVDQEITHPTELDFYLQSHAGLLGTSRPAHYNILYDENDFSADALQALSFALCHVYARSTRSVSIPAPVYYADIVCSRAKNHYAPDSNLNPDESETHTGAGSSQLERFRTQFKELHPNMKKVMYFS